MNEKKNMSYKKISALSFIDELLGGLCRGGPTKDRTYGCYVEGSISPFLELFDRLDIREVQPPMIPGLVTYDLGPTVIPHALKLARASLEVVLDAIPKAIKLPILDQLSAFLSMRTWSMEEFVVNAKYSVAYPMARFLHNDLPQKPSSFTCHPLVYTGRIKRMLKNRLVSFSLKNARLFQGILQGVKRGAEVVPKDFVHAAMLKHRAALSKLPKNLEPKTGDPAKAFGFSWFEASELDQYFKRFFRHFRPPQPKLFEASTAASFESKRSEGGSREYLRDFSIGLIDDHREPSEEERDVYKLLDSDPIHSDLLEMYEVRPGEVEEVRGRATWSSFNHYFEEVRKMDLHRSVMVSAVLEPLKVRLITKGETFKYYLSRFYQKGLWRHLQRYPQFALTGRPLCEMDFIDLFAREKKLGVDFDLWVSGDYSAATDNLKIFYTKMAFEESLLKARYSEDLQDRLRAVLYEQEIVYPDSTGIDPVEQLTGQLMGSTLSFPILCTVNLCAYWMSLERYLHKITGQTRRIKCRDLPVLVNGDDILFRTNRDHYAMWREIVAEVGFELSQGKNYVHNEYFTVNSQGFFWNKGKPMEVPYLNVGLLTGQSKLAGRLSERMSPVWDYYNQVIDGAISPVRAHRRFFHYHKENINELTASGEFSVFAHPALGGLGFKLHPEVKSGIYFTPFQRRFAYYLGHLLRQPFEGDFSKFSPFRGLIHERRSMSTSVHRKRFHHGFYEVRPQVGPLMEGEREVRNVEEAMESARLSLGLNTEKVVLVVRPPDHKIMTGFRSSQTYEANDSKVTSFPYRWIEIKPILPKPGTIETNPGPYHYVFMDTNLVFQGKIYWLWYDYTSFSSVWCQNYEDPCRTCIELHQNMLGNDQWFRSDDQPIYDHLRRCDGC